MKKSQIAFRISIPGIILLFVLFNCTKRQLKNRIPDNALVVSGSRYMLPADFTHRLRFTPHRSLRGMTLPKKRELYLQPLIYELLFANAADQLHLDTNQVYQLKLREIKKDYVREELYQKEVGERVKVSKDQIKEALDRYQHELTLSYLSFETREEAQYAHDLISSGEATFDEVVGILRKPGAKAPKINVKWGQLVPSVEDSVYRLKQGEVTGIIGAQKGFLIMRLDTVTQVEPAPNETPIKRLEKVQKTLKDRDLDIASDKYVQQVMSKVNINVNHAGAKLLEQYVKAHQPEPPSDSLARKPVESKEIRKLLQYSKGELNKPLVHFDGIKWTIKQFLEIAYARGIRLPDKPKPVPPWIKQTLGQLMEDEVLARKGFAQHLDTTATVRHQVNRWDNYYSSRLYTSYLGKQFTSDSVDTKQIANLIDSLNTVYHPKIDSTILNKLPVDNTEMIAIKRGYPNRIAVPPYPNVLLEFELAMKDSTHKSTH